MSTPEAALVIQSREELAELLTEACEIEHNLMCCYLFAAWSLKTAEDGLGGAQLAAVERWRSSIVNVAIDEMAHLVNANNLLVALGGPAHLRRPNFPIPRGYHPADIVVELHPFDQSTIDHFVFLERPEGVDHPDGEAFSHSVRYQRVFSPRPCCRRRRTTARLVTCIVRCVQASNACWRSWGRKRFSLATHRCSSAPTW
ncbi:MAG: ferritin-like domain-containing protein [Polyangiaceae bacterium]